MQALLVKEGGIHRITLSPGDSPQEIHDHIGNWFTTCFRVPGDGPHHSIDAYCDDEFLLRDGIDWNVVLEQGTLYAEPYPIGGPIVIVGGDTLTGESRSLTEQEAARFAIDRTRGMLVLVEGWRRSIPTLTYRKEG
jgi:hypothetical protein